MDKLHNQIGQIRFGQAQQRLATLYSEVRKSIGDETPEEFDLLQGNRLDRLPSDDSLASWQFSAAALNRWRPDETTPAGMSDLMDYLDELDALPSQTVKITETQSDKLLKRFYRLYNRDPRTLPAIMAFVDVLVDEAMRNGSMTIGFLDFIENVFVSIITYGLNIWSLHRRWQSSLFRLRVPEQIHQLEQEYEKQRGQREQIAAELINSLEAFNRNTKSQPIRAEYYNHSISGLFRSSLNREDVIRAVCLKVTCADVNDCFQVEQWAERQGDVQHGLMRKYLYHPQLITGARRFQVGVFLEKYNRLLIVRAGDRDLHSENDWGALYRLTAGKSPFPKLSSAPQEEENTITLYLQNGQKLAVPAESTLDESLEKLELLLGNKIRALQKVWVNTGRVDGKHRLTDGDVLQVRFTEHPTNNDLLILKADHRFPRAQLEHEMQQDDRERRARLGRDRLHQVINEYLERWKFSLRSDHLPLLLRVRGFSAIDAELQNAYIQLWRDKSEDAALCELALSYCLKRHIRIIYQDSEALVPWIRWTNIKLAQCCRPTPADAIIGTIVRGATDENHPDFGMTTLRIHKRGCKFGPEKAANEVKLEWEFPEEIPIGLMINVFINDVKGSIGQLLDLFYLHSSLEIYHVMADALNYHPKALIKITAIASSRFLKDETIHLLESQYGANNVTAFELQASEVKQILSADKQNPYDVVSEQIFEKERPQIFVGRSEENGKLIHVLNSETLNIAVMQGYYRVGKTWLLNALRLTLSNQQFVCAFIDCRHIRLTGKGALFDLVDTIYTTTRRAIYDHPELRYTKALQTGSKPKALEDLELWLSPVIKDMKYRFVIMLDEFTTVVDWLRKKKLSDSEYERIIHYLTVGTERIKFIVVFQAASNYNLGTPEARDLQNRFLNAVPRRSVVNVRPLEKNDIEALFKGPVRDQYDVSPEALQRVFELTGGFAYLATRLASELYIEATGNKITWIEPEMIDEIAIRLRQDNSWFHYLTRMVTPLSKETIEQLQDIARFEQGCLDSGRWWCATDDVLVRKKTAKNSEEIITNMLRADLLEEQEGQSGSYRLRSELLSTFLAEQPIEYLVTRDGD